ncbi:MAG: DUF3365 domain-containing protein [Coriobacteriales bacterium]|nr:DUF3365 domain-containing protein [Coriobacteriales bacterium]
MGSSQKPKYIGVRTKIAMVIVFVVLAATAADLIWNQVFYQNVAQSQALEKAELLTQEMRAVWDYNNNVQDVANRNEDGTVRSKQLVCVVAAKAVSALFTQKTDYEITFVRNNPRQASAEPDEFERQALQAFEQGEQSYYGVVHAQTGDSFRYLVPLYTEQSCLECHGDPAGELDQYGYAKEGMKEGDIAGAISITEPMAMYYEAARTSSLGQLTVMLALVFFILAVLYAATSRLILKPVRLLEHAASQVANGDLSASFTLPATRTKDEMIQLGDELENMACRLRVLYNDFETEVASQTEELTRLNAELVEREKALQDAMERLTEEMSYKNDFFAIVSHELKTPLTSIIAYSRMLDDDKTLSPHVHDSIQEIQHNAVNLLNMVNNILILAKNDAGRNEVVLDPVDVVDLVGHLKNTVKPIAQAKGIELTTRIAPGVSLIMADQEKLRRILENLVDNAIKYTRSGGHVDVDVSLANNMVQFRVSDTGNGIDSQDIKYIFERFLQLGSSKKRSKGTGLGLAVVKELALLMGGSVRVESAVQKGSTFIVDIPNIPVDMEEYNEDTCC